MHKGIAALVQASKVTVIRDKNKNGIWEKDEPSETGWYGINIHPRFSSGDVGNNSAGCTVIDSLPEQRVWRDFMLMVNTSGQTEFEYIVMAVKVKTKNIVVLFKVRRVVYPRSKG